MKIVYRAENIIDANLVKAALEAEGLFAYVAGESLIGGVGELPARDFVNVFVADIDVERAMPVAQAIDAELVERRAEPDDFRDDALPA